MDTLLVDYPKDANCECKTGDHIVEGRPFYFDLPPPITPKGNFTFSYGESVNIKAKFLYKIPIFLFFIFISLILSFSLSLARNSIIIRTTFQQKEIQGLERLVERNQ